MRSTLAFCIILPTFFLLDVAAGPQPGYGYIGPACAVVEGSLYLHGVPRRQLNESEIVLFSSYQDNLSTFRSGFSSPSSMLMMDAPLVPSFCGDYDDSLEVVLASCIVRNSHVYVGEKLIRPLKIDEKRKLETFLIHKASMTSTSQHRRKRDVGSPATTQRDISTLLHQLLNVNSTVTSRFLPVVSQSPLFSMDGLHSFLGTTGTATTPAATTSTNEPTTVLTTSGPTKATFKTLAPEIKKTTIAPIKTTVPSLYQTIRPGTIRTLPLNRYPSSKRTHRRKPTVAIPTTTAETIQLPLGGASPVIEETVSDPFILKLLQKALENNQLLDTLNLSGRSPPTSSVPFHGNVEETKSQPDVKLHFVSPSPSYPQLIRNVQNPANTIPGPQPNVPFGQHNAFSGVKQKSSQKPRKVDLPDEICTAHLKNEIP